MTSGRWGGASHLPPVSPRFVGPRMSGHTGSGGEGALGNDPGGSHTLRVWTEHSRLPPQPTRGDLRPWIHLKTTGSQTGGHSTAWPFQSPSSVYGAGGVPSPLPHTHPSCARGTRILGCEAATQSPPVRTAQGVRACGGRGRRANGRPCWLSWFFPELGQGGLKRPPNPPAAP